MKPGRVPTPHVRADPLVCSEFREGRGYASWRPRGSGDWLLIFTLGGAGRIVAGGKARRLGPGSAVLFAPDATQDYATDPEIGLWQLRWAHFAPRPHWRPWLAWPSVAPGTGWLGMEGTAWASFGQALERMLAAYRLEGLGGASGTDLAMNGLEEALLWAFRHVAGGRRPGIDARVEQAVRHLALNPAEPFRLDALAARCGLSPSRLSHLFRENLGTTPQRFGERLRLDHARQLLARTNLSVGEVAAEVGFDDPFYFSRRFAKAFGVAPGRARGIKPS